MLLRYPTLINHVVDPGRHVMNLSADTIDGR